MKIEITTDGKYTITGEINPKPSSSGKSTLLISEKIDDADQDAVDSITDGRRIRGMVTAYIAKK